MDAFTVGEQEHGQPTVDINDLPDEIIRLIFSYFTPQLLSSCLAKVSSKWHRITREPHLWRRLALNGNSVFSATHLFGTAPLEQLRVLTVSEWRSNCEALILLVSTHCPSLTELEYNVREVSGGETVSNECLWALSSRCPNITRLALRRVRATGSVSRCGDREAFDWFIKLRALEIEIKAWKLSALPFRNCTGLRSLSVSITGENTDAFAENFRAFIARYRTILNGLDVRVGRVSDELFATIAACVHIERLVLTDARSLGAGTLAALARQLTQLRSLILSKPARIRSVQLIAALTPAGRLTNLTQLSFTSVGFALHDDALMAIADRFASQLTKLTLDDCCFPTDTGLTRIVLRCFNLEELELCDLENVSGSFLHMFPEYLPRLRSFTVTKCGFEREHITALKTAMPGLKVIG